MALDLDRVPPSRRRRAVEESVLDEPVLDEPVDEPVLDEPVIGSGVRLRRNRRVVEIDQSGVDQASEVPQTNRGAPPSTFRCPTPCRRRRIRDQGQHPFGVVLPPDSVLYDNTIPEVWFASEELAQANGFVKAPNKPRLTSRSGGQIFRITVTTLPRIAASLPGIGSNAGL